jgi:serine protease Do
MRKKIMLMIIGAIFIGVIAGIIIASNFDWTYKGIASEQNTSKVFLGSSSAPLTVNAGVEQLENAFVSVAEDVKPSVVTITSAKIYKMRQTAPFSEFFGDDFFQYFFGNPNYPDRQRDRERSNDAEREEREYRQEGLGSGVIVSSDGYIITNNHVVREADEIKVFTINDKEYDAKVIGTDAQTDVAVIKIEEKNLPAIRLGDSDKVRVGQWVLAIGNPFMQELEHTVTQGIVSAKGRSGINLSESPNYYADFIQTDAAINPGNSGGALVNLRGELIGINTAIITGGGSSGNVGIGFAIPINLTRHVMEMLIDKGRVVRGFLGVYPQDIDEDLAQAYGLKDTKGAFIAQVSKGEPADLAGIKYEDVIVEIDGKKVDDANQLRLIVASYEPGVVINAKIIRSGKEVMIPIKLGERDDDKTQDKPQQQKIERLGIRVENLTPENLRQYNYSNDEIGVVVVNVKQGSIAFREGIREGDIIAMINRHEIKDEDSFLNTINSIKSGEVVTMRVKKQSIYFVISFKMLKE